MTDSIRPTLRAARTSSPVDANSLLLSSQAPVQMSSRLGRLVEINSPDIRQTRIVPILLFLRFLRWNPSPGFFRGRQRKVRVVHRAQNLPRPVGLLAPDGQVLAAVLDGCRPGGGQGHGVGSAIIGRSEERLL